MGEKLINARIHEISPNHPPHPCSVRYCDPQNEQTLIRRGLLPGPPELPEHMYVCIFGDIHVCNENVCMTDGPCLVSGATMGLVHEYSSYNANDSRTWTDPKKGQVSTGGTGTHKLWDRVELLISTLFFSPKRKAIVANWKKQRGKQCKKYKDTYIKDCELKRKPVNLIHLAMLDAQYNIPCPIEERPEYDGDRLEHYTRLALHMYQLIQGYNDNEKVCVESVTLGVLYKMQQGININDVNVLPADPYLVQILPPMNDLVKLSIDKKRINRGEQLLLGMYETALRNGTNLVDLKP